jgi:uncharacterized protein YggE
MLVSALSILPGSAQSWSGAGREVIEIREVAAVRALPDTLYILMKVESQSARLSHAIADNERQIAEFGAALERQGFARSALKTNNFVVAPVYESPGVIFSRNLVITVPGINRKTPDEITALLARAQDLGARYGSSCITCIGSG